VPAYTNAAPAAPAQQPPSASATQAPPPSPVDYVPVAPGPDYYWVPGYWFGGVATLGGYTKGGAEETVKVIEIKTVGAYEVAMLSAQDSGGLARWLQAHNFSVPAEKSGIIDEYLRKGWCFIAAKIRLHEGVAFRMASSGGRKDTGAPVARKAVQKQLSSGELHPLLISFDTPTCIFPLRISAVGGKPSEVSLYVLSAEPLLDRFTFERSLEKIDRSRVEWEEARPQREQARAISLQNMRIELLLKLFEDPAPQVRLHAVRASGPNWDRRLVAPLMALFRDPDPEIRGEATLCLCAHKTAGSSPFYVELLSRSD